MFLPHKLLQTTLMDVLAGRKTVGTITGQSCLFSPSDQNCCQAVRVVIYSYHNTPVVPYATLIRHSLFVITAGDIRVNGFQKNQSTFASIAGCEYL